MSWAKVDDGLYDDPRFEAAGLEAMGLWVAALSYMGRYLTDGVIDEARVRRIAGRRAQTLTDRLVSAGWWEREPGGKLRLISWDTYLLSRAEVEADRERKSTAGRRGAERTNAKRLESGPAGAAAGAVGASDGSRARDPDPVPSRPVPTPEEDPPVVPRGGTSEREGFRLEPPPPAARKGPKASKGGKPLPAPTEEARRVFDAFLRGRTYRRMQGPGPVLDAKRIKIVADRLAEGFTVDMLAAAAQGIWLSDWHVEKEQARFDLALRDAEHIERFATLHHEKLREVEAERAMRERAAAVSAKPKVDDLGKPPTFSPSMKAEVEAFVREYSPKVAAHG